MRAVSKRIAYQISPLTRRFARPRPLPAQSFAASISQKAVSPQLHRLAIMFNADNTQPVLEMGETQAEARRLGLEVAIRAIRRAEDIAPAFQDLKPKRTQFTLPSINLLFLTARALSRLHLASGCPRFSAPGISLKPERSCPTDQITRICSDTRQILWAKFCVGRTQRYTGRAANKIRAGHQFRDCQGARLHHAAVAARPRRRCDRIEMLFAAEHRSHIGT